MADLTSFLTDAQAKLGNQAAVNKSGNNTYRVKASTVEVSQQPTYSTWTIGGATPSTDNIFNLPRITSTHPFNNVPDSVVSDLRTILNGKLAVYELNRSKPQ